MIRLPLYVLAAGYATVSLAAAAAVFWLHVPCELLRRVTR